MEYENIDVESELSKFRSISNDVLCRFGKEETERFMDYHYLEISRYFKINRLTRRFFDNFDAEIRFLIPKEVFNYDLPQDMDDGSKISDLAETIVKDDLNLNEFGILLEQSFDKEGYKGFKARRKKKAFFPKFKELSNDSSYVFFNENKEVLSAVYWVYNEESEKDFKEALNLIDEFLNRK